MSLGRRAGALAIGLLPLLCLAWPARAAPPDGMVRIAGGEYQPFYPVAGEPAVQLASFDLDVVPVTNAKFLAFVREAPRWRRSQVPPLLAEQGYLQHWAEDLELGPSAALEQPVTFVSWFAAAAYCRAQGKHLPREAEWEFAARVSDGDDAPKLRARILDWYARPHRELAPVGRGEPNVRGVYDLHGLIWEWVLDFNASLVSADDRQRGDRELQRFCGGAAVGASDVSDYAAFMRIGFRSSLGASYGVHNLGFRCAREAS